MSKTKIGAMWEDKEVLFDLPFAYLKLRPGEKIFDRIEPIEDTKGNTGSKGRMIVTNLRIIWHSMSSPRINLSVGLNCIQSTSTKVVNSGLRGTTQALHMLAAYRSSRYEFVFTNLAPNCVRHYTSVSGVHKAYAASRPYRDLKLRSAIIQNKQLRILPLERICLNEHSIWNLSSESGNLGTLIVTNVRVVWFADINESFNVSLPYLTIESISTRDSKFGEALVIATRQSSGGYVLGFRADPRERLHSLRDELQELHRAYCERPVLGVEMNWNEQPSKPPTDDIEELQEIGEPRGEMGPNLYLASQLAQYKRRSAIVARIRLREEWSELKGPEEPSQKSLKQIPEIIRKTQKPVRSASKVVSQKVKYMKNVQKSPPKKNPKTVLKNVTNASQKTKNPILKNDNNVSSMEVLRGIVALVDVGTETRALALRAALMALGATVVPAWSPLVTHLVWTQGGDRATRAKGRALACRVVSPLWVEACASCGRRVPEAAFPAAARPSDLPSPRALRIMLKRAEAENIPLSELFLNANKQGERKSNKERSRLRISSEQDTSTDQTDTSHDRSTDRTDTSLDQSRDTTDPERRVNTLPRGGQSAPPPPPAHPKSRRKLFTQKEAEVISSDDESDTPAAPKRMASAKLTQRERRDLARAERLARRLLGAATPAKTQILSQTTEVPRIVLTGMSRSERQIVQNAIKTLNGRVQKQVNHHTTHVLLGSCQSSLNQINLDHTGINSLNQTTRSHCSKIPSTNTRIPVTQLPSTNTRVPVTQLPRCEIPKARTLNALLGAARGCRVLYAQWVMDSLEVKKWLHHHGYEVPHLKKISQKARVERSALGRTCSEYAYDVFSGMRVQISPQTEQRDAAIQLLSLCGGVVQNGGDTQDGGDAQDGGRRTADFDVCVGSGEGEVASKWVFDSVAAGRMRTTRRYVNALAAG